MAAATGEHYPRRVRRRASMSLRRVASLASIAWVSWFAESVWIFAPSLPKGAWGRISFGPGASALQTSAGLRQRPPALPRPMAASLALQGTMGGLRPSSTAEVLELGN
eukprot:scaffold996_cov409-Prasinococcus_capsulatus_cf.AAC.11